MKRIISILLAVMLLLNVLPAQPVYAAEGDAEEVSAALLTSGVDDIKQAVETINSAIGVLPRMTKDERSAVIQIFSGLGSAASSAASLIGVIDTCTTFMKLLGLMRDPVRDTIADIKKQLDDMKEELDEMYTELIEVSNEMKTLTALTDFKLRAQEATTMLTNWNDFTTEYMENTMDALMNEYQAMVIEGWKDWMRGNRVNAKDGIDNTSAILVYDKTADGYALRFFAGNEVPSDLDPEARYVILPAEMFPATMAWNIDTYRKDLEDYISARILEANAGEGYEGFVSYNYPAFSAEEAGAMTVETARTAAKDAIDVISYRISHSAVNDNAKFAIDVKARFENYCSRLFKPKTGMEAILNAYYLTHAFEFEIRDDLQDLCNEMIAKTGVYGVFAMNVLGMSGDVTSSEKEATASEFCRTIQRLADDRSDCVTGVDQYCYLTSSEIYVTDMSFETEASVNTSADAQVDAYLGYSASRPTVTFLDGATTVENLIGHTKMMLIDYTLRSNGSKFDSQFMEEHFRENLYYDRAYAVTEFDPDVNFPVDKAYSVRVRKPDFGEFFTNNSVIGLNTRPGKATTDQYVYHRMAKGSVVDTATGNLETEKLLSGLAIYGESHWFWVDDETAFLGGPADYRSFSSYMFTVCTDDVGKKYYTHYYGQLAEYNAICMRSLPFSDTVNDPLASFRDLSNSLTLEGLKEAHEWDEGVVIKEPTCGEPGIRRYTALDDESITYDEEIEVLPHDWDEGVVLEEPSCVEKGIRLYTCQNDPSHTYTEGIDAPGHDWSDWVITKEPEDYKDGERQRVCRVCHETETEVLPKLVDYTVTTGADGTWTKGSGTGYSITVKRTKDDAGCYIHYLETLIDGKTVAATAKAGSTVVTIGADVLEALSEGTHAVTVRFDDGKAETDLTIEAKSGGGDPSAPDTGDDFRVGLWLALLAFSGFSFLAAFGERKKRGANRL